MFKFDLVAINKGGLSCIVANNESSIIQKCIHYKVIYSPNMYSFYLELL